MDISMKTSLYGGFMKIKIKNMDWNDPFRDRGNWDNPNSEKVLCLNVTRTSFSGERPNLYECTRKYWRLNGERAAKADLVFAVIIGTILVRWCIHDQPELTIGDQVVNIGTAFRKFLHLFF